jgi:cob(I)alamin adenosyltransferase
MDGQLQIYTGDGKGKTTSAVGLTVRAAGAGLRVAFIQFDKGSEAEDFYSERKVLRKLPEVEVIPTGKIRMMPNGQFRFTNSPPDFAEAKRGLSLAIEAVSSKKYALVICDEILSCLLTTLLVEADVLSLISTFEKTEKTCDLVMTGRSLPEAIKEKADLVSEMKMVKHYFNKGLPARKGIEF